MLIYIDKIKMKHQGEEFCVSGSEKSPYALVFHSATKKKKKD